MYCTTKALKYILFIFNIICAILGATLIWFGLWLLSNISDVRIKHGEKLASILTIVLGAVVLTIALYGCVATFMESKSMLICFAVLLIVLMVIQLILVSISYTAASDGLSDGLRKGFDELWDSSDYTNSTLSYYEEWLHCCGKNSAEDYFLLDKIPPSSCCKDGDCSNVYNLYVDGCEQKFKEYVREKTSNFNIISWLLIIIEFSGSVVACILVDSIRNHRDRRRLYS